MAGKNERQRRQARERYRRQQETRTARQRQVRKRWLTGISAVAAVGLIAALLVVFLPGGSGKKASASASKSPSASASASASAATVAEPAHHCTYTKATPVSRTVSFPPATPDYTASYTATINTNLGPITVNLLNSKATCTVNSFVHLAEAGYFNNTQCHRMVTSGPYVLQCGDAYATSTTKLDCSSTSTMAPGRRATSSPARISPTPPTRPERSRWRTEEPRPATAASSSSCTRTAVRRWEPLHTPLRHDFIWAGYRPECGEGWILVYISPGRGRRQRSEEEGHH